MTVGAKTEWGLEKMLRVDFGVWGEGHFNGSDKGLLMGSIIHIIPNIDQIFRL